MANMLPVAVYGLRIEPEDGMIPAMVDFPATIRITMAAIDPSTKARHADVTNDDQPSRATLKMVFDPSGGGTDDSEDSDDEDAYLKALQDGVESDGLSDEEDEDSEDEEQNGGPSDPSKSTKARKEAAAQSILDALEHQESDEENKDAMDTDQTPKVNGLANSNASKGKGKAKVEDDEDEQDSESESAAERLEEVVICTLDTSKTYQQPIDITIPEDQTTYFKVSGNHTVYLTGNYVLPPDEGRDRPQLDEDEYDLSPDEDELDLEDDESDELDDIEDPRITEIPSDEEDEAPKLVRQELRKQDAQKKGKNKRLAEDSDEDVQEGVSIDGLISKSLKPEEPTTNGEPKLSKKQLKKLKNNAGKPVEAPKDKDNKEEPAAKGDKKVQFAKELEQGPSSSPSTLKAEVNGVAKSQSKKQEDKSKPSLGVKMMQGVKIDDKKLGKGPVAKKGDTLGMRFIGKLSDGRVFDANRKGNPFKLKLGAGDVVKGWEMGVTGMSVQGERRIIVPANLGHGPKAVASIPANSELTLDVKLLSIE